MRRAFLGQGVQLLDSEEEHINQILWEALLSAPDTNAASLRAGALKAALNQQHKQALLPKPLPRDSSHDINHVWRRRGSINKLIF